MSGHKQHVVDNTASCKCLYVCVRVFPFEHASPVPLLILHLKHIFDLYRDFIGIRVIFLFRRFAGKIAIFQ